jgi:hypothetical protein
MADLADYSGKFIPGVRFEDFSRDALLKLVKLYSKIYLGYMGMWNTVMRQQMSAEELSKYETEVYVRTARQFEAPGVTKALNIRGNDVVTLVKLMQMIPDGSRQDMYDSIYEVKNNNHVILTIKSCPTLLFWERHGNTKAIDICCSVGGMEEVTIVEYANFVNPDIKVTALKVPPRKSKDDIACQWELKLEPKK